MNQDETPTPKQSGSYAIMQDICKTTLRVLATWRLRSVDDPARWAQIRRREDAFRALLETVKSWPAATPTPPAKLATVEAIIAARTEAAAWGALFGWTL